MKPIAAIIAAMLLFAGSFGGFCQGFVNLNFNSANIPSGTSSGTFVPISEAIPGWMGYIGTDPRTTVSYNGLDGGAANIALLATNMPGTIPGYAYTVVLQSGQGLSGVNVSTSIAQTGLIPANAESILFTANLPFQVGWQVTIAGQIIPVTEISALGADFGVYAGDVSAFAGQVDQLEFTALGSPTTYSAMGLDGISFSSSPAPEPGELALMGAGGILFGWRRWRKFAR